MQSPGDGADSPVYVVVKNDEDQYSIWAQDQPMPPGWEAVGFTGTREECIERIDEIWTDMRPKSVREHLAS